MKIKMSKNQWEGIGKQAGWIKTAQPIPQQQAVEEEDSPIDIVNDPRTDTKALLELANNSATPIDVLSAIVRATHIPRAVKNAVFNNPSYKARQESLM